MLRLNLLFTCQNRRQLEDAIRWMDMETLNTLKESAMNWSTTKPDVVTKGLQWTLGSQFELHKVQL